MLPKVATTVLHSTSRAAAAVQGQTHTIRNVLQLQSSPSSSNKSTSPGSNYFNPNKGTSEPLHNYFNPNGGSKGSRFTHGYLGASRAVTQVHLVIANDIGYTQGDEYEEIITVKHVPLHHRKRYRSHSLSYSSQEPSQKLSVLSTVQLHARTRHAFARSLTTDDIATEVHEPLPASPVLTRRNSTASVTRPESVIDEPPPPPPLRSPSPVLDSSVLSIENTNPHARPNQPPPAPENMKGVASEYFNAFIHARTSGDHEAALLTLSNYRAALDARIVTPSLHDINAALEALYFTRPPGEPITDIQDLYNTMVRLGLFPNYRTYVILITALLDRDQEVIWALNGLNQRLSNQAVLNSRSTVSPEDKARKNALEKENNFSSAMSLFRILRTIPSNGTIPVATFTLLLRSCAHYGNIDSAIMIWETLEQESIKPSAIMYKYMIQTFGRAGEINGAVDVFTDYRERSAAGLLEWSTSDNDHSGPARASLQVWNVMIEAHFKCGQPDMGVALLEEMLTPRDSSSVDPSTLFDQPFPAPSTYSTVIAGFCHSGDVQSALLWFNTLLPQASPAGHPYDSSASPSRPDVLAWRVLFEKLAQSPDMLPTLNTLWAQFLKYSEKDRLDIRMVDRKTVAHANLARVRAIKEAEADSQLSEESLKECSDLLAAAASTIPFGNTFMLNYTNQIWELSFSLGLPLQGKELGLRFFGDMSEKQKALRAPLVRFSSLIFSQNWDGLEPATAGLRDALSLLALWRGFEVVHHQDALFSHILTQYSRARSESLGLADLTDTAIHDLLTTVSHLEMLEPQSGSQAPADFAGVVPFLEDLVRERPGVTFDQPDTRATVFKALLWDRSLYQVQALLQQLGLTTAFQRELDDIETATQNLTSSPSISSSVSGSEVSQFSGETASSNSSVSPLDVVYDDVNSLTIPGRIVTDRSLTRNMEELLTKRVSPSSRPAQVVEQAWAMFERHLKVGRVPSPFTLSRLCQALGRAKDVEKVKQVYSVAQALLSTMEHDKQAQSDSWFLFENSMIIALAQAGEIDAAHVHRRRILEQGGAPSADAYGGLILLVKDTTDDTSNALALFNESQMHQVIPNHYLYNNIISKLAKARKADAALELFTRMKASGLPPSSITYGAVIGACARVGDAASAEMLYAEMVQAKNFKPRIPPFNTMMQLYTTTKPNRDRALFYYNEILKAGVQPTEYTYKLLMEAYVIEPLDIAKMEQVFQELVNNRRLEVQGSHFATLINAYGCVGKDLDKAISVFNSIFTHFRRPKVDALVFEAIANVCVAHRRADLFPQFVSQMSDAGVHMTAYVVNLMIKGYAAVGEVEKARELFESLMDPPEGVAALYNHAPHEPSNRPVVNPMEPVYREPSTWEAMVRAELGAGNRAEAISLISRLVNRKYPEAVVNRIRGIMVDHSQILP